MRTDNLNDSIITKIIRRIEKLESSGMLNSASISYGRLRLIGGELLGQAGAVLNWIGSANFTGPFTNSGSFDNSGPFTNTGPFTNSGTFTNTGPFNNSGKLTNTGELEQNGNAKFNGNFETTGSAKIGGATEITGVTTLKTDLNVTGNGRLKVGTMMLDPTIASGAMTFSNGGQVFTDGDSIQVYKGNAVVQLEGGSAKLQYGGSAVVIDADGVHIYGAFYVHNLPTVTDDANAFADPDSGRIGKTAD